MRLDFLDVLTVWHAFLLNPGNFRRHCEVNVLPYLKHVSFPWTRIVSVFLFFPGIPIDSHLASITPVKDCTRILTS